MKKFIVLEDIIVDSEYIRDELEHKGYMKLTDIPVYKCAEQVFEFQGEGVYIDVSHEDTWELSDDTVAQFVADGVIKEIK